MRNEDGRGWEARLEGRLETNKANPNKPNRVKTFLTKEIAHECEKRTQASYVSRHQRLTAKLGRFLKGFRWLKTGGRLRSIPVREQGPFLQVLAESWEGDSSKR